MPIVNGSSYSSFGSRHGFSTELLVLNPGEKVDLVFEEEFELRGVFFVWGPDTSYLDLFLDGKKTTLTMRDEMSFYRRIGFHFFGGAVSTKRLEMVAAQYFLNIDLQREPWEEIREHPLTYIVGFATLQAGQWMGRCFKEPF